MVVQTGCNLEMVVLTGCNLEMGESVTAGLVIERVTAGWVVELITADCSRIQMLFQTPLRPL